MPAGTETSQCELYYGRLPCISLSRGQKLAIIHCPLRRRTVVSPCTDDFLPALRGPCFCHGTVDVGTDEPDGYRSMPAIAMMHHRE